MAAGLLRGLMGGGGDLTSGGGTLMLDLHCYKPPESCRVDQQAIMKVWRDHKVGGLGGRPGCSGRVGGCSQDKVKARTTPGRRAVGDAVWCRAVHVWVAGVRQGEGGGLGLSAAGAAAGLAHAHGGGKGRGAKLSHGQGHGVPTRLHPATSHTHTRTNTLPQTDKPTGRQTLHIHTQPTCL